MNLLRRWRDWRESRIWAKQPLDSVIWEQTVQASELLLQLCPADRRKLHRLVSLFLHEKYFEPVQGMQLSQLQRAIIAAFACLPVLRLGYHWLTGWRSVVVYPDAFRVLARDQDEAGVVHEWSDLRSGESWHDDGIILSWEDVAADLQPGYPGNLVIHEIAHKLDLRDGVANGCPPLHGAMSPQRWRHVFSAAFDQLTVMEASGSGLPIDPYALESPAEFFAVTSEYYFVAPQVLDQSFPELFAQLGDFYAGRHAD